MISGPRTNGPRIMWLHSLKLKTQAPEKIDFVGRCLLSFWGKRLLLRTLLLLSFREGDPQYTRDVFPIRVDRIGSLTMTIDTSGRRWYWVKCNSSLSWRICWDMFSTKTLILGLSVWWRHVIIIQPKKDICLGMLFSSQKNTCTTEITMMLMMIFGVDDGDDDPDVFG